MCQKVHSIILCQRSPVSFFHNFSSYERTTIFSHCNKGTWRMSTEWDSLIESTMQDQLNNLTKDVKRMTSSITMLINAITPSRAVTQSDQNDSGMDPQTVLGVHKGSMKLKRLRKQARNQGKISRGLVTILRMYVIEEPTREFLNSILHRFARAVNTVHK